jgi:hypothetical protein
MSAACSGGCAHHITDHQESGKAVAPPAR